MDDRIIDSKEITLLYSNIVNLIDYTKEKVFKTVNTDIINLCWNIVRTIKEEIIKKERADYGKQIIDNLSKELTENYGKGYSRSNLFRMVQFYDYFSAEEIVATLSQ